MNDYNQFKTIDFYNNAMSQIEKKNPFLKLYRELDWGGNRVVAERD